MQARRITLVALATLLVVAGSAAAHERYETDDGKYTIVLGEQNEPVYTYDWTNLDLIISENAGDGGHGHGESKAVNGVEETLNVTLIAPNGEELSMPITPQHGSEGRYEFAQGYYLTLPGQYKARLEGTINGTPVDGEYLLPGPRGDMTTRAFPAPVEKDLRELAAENADLRSQLDDLRSEVDALKAEQAALKTAAEDANNAPGFGLTAAIAAVGAIALWRRREA